MISQGSVSWPVQMAFDRSLEVFLGEFLARLCNGVAQSELGAVSAGYF